MKLLLLLLALMAAGPVTDDVLDAAARICGASSPEDLSESEAERFEALSRHPLDLNRASRRTLVASGLFSPYQAASLLDYISRYGEICSVAELAAVDGIGPGLASDLSFFVVLEPGAPLGAVPRARLRADGMARTARKTDDYWPTAAKLSVSYGGHAREFGGALAVKDFRLVSGHASYRERRFGVVLGDFGARFGQGLLSWTGFTMSTLYTPSAFARFSTGLSGANSFSEGSVKRGAALEFSVGLPDFGASRDTPDFGVSGGRGPSLDFSAFATLDGQQYLHGGLLSRRGSYGLGLLHSPGSLAASADWRFSLGKFTLFGESAVSSGGSAVSSGGSAVSSGGSAVSSGGSAVSSGGSAVSSGGSAVMPDYDRASLSLRAGAFYNHSYGRRAALLLRASPDEYAFALGAETRVFSLTCEILKNRLKNTSQMKAVALCSPSFALGSWTLQPALRLNSRYRPEDARRWRVDLRSDLGAACGPWQLHFRYNTVRCEQWSHLAYLETGWKRDKTSVYLRGTLFLVDKWNDRIYVYERDTPGSFNVPAFYGRGYALSLYARWRWLSLRASTTRYPSMPEKSPKYELKLQVNLKH